MIPPPSHVPTVPDSWPPGGDECVIIGTDKVDKKESVEIAKAVEEDKSVEAEQVIESAEFEQMESA